MMIPREHLEIQTMEKMWHNLKVIYLLLMMLLDSTLSKIQSDTKEINTHFQNMQNMQPHK